MTATADPADVPPKKKSKLPLILGVILALAGGAGGFLAVQMGLIGGNGTESEGGQDTHAETPAPVPLQPMAFVAIDPLVVNLPRATGREFLRFTAQLEVVPDHLAEVESLRPRIVDVMNGYLRAVEPADFEDQMILSRLRSQLLRRIQIVTGEGRVRDLLIIEFVLN